ncbi:DUF262 domain-containing protein [Bacillus cereus group sp. TH150LC]|uniref:DUF262 domain-containing protein n=1 Tax=Bacillus cereus group sp. TH150LC TaxID=3018061 RepID=UPI0022DF4B2A|nr:DUF262 domain-containing protein [Bacillus cereus group sp. TH150LC]MDA1658164.1 DUF262 domain-containing protein [Bacillus cereus group sp. TH150LC]HDR4513820.1 DUF262 domain-containing protein [Bacillus cereus]
MDKYPKNQTETIEKSIDEFYGFEYEGFEYEEYELDEYEEDYEHPFDADKIRIDQQMLSLKYLMELMSEKQIILNPGFQRNKVWTERKRKSLLIESLMLRIPIPAFYFYENEDSKFIVIDGLQRLSTINDFINNKFRLFGLEYLEKFCGGKTFSELDVKYQQRIFRTQLAVNILDARSPSNVVFDIFRRVNTGGVSLKPQEIRNAISKNSTRYLLKTLYKSDEFQSATRNRIKDDRMDGQEFILRFFAFHRAYNYTTSKLNYTSGNIAVFLDNALIALNEASDIELAQLEENFKRAMDISNILFKNYTFRKCYITKNNTVYSNMDIINKALYTSWAVILSNPKYIDFDFSKLGDKVLKKLAQELTKDTRYDSCLTQGTNSTRSVQYSFYKANSILSEVFEFDF